jgi:hypothetical protein
MTRAPLVLSTAAIFCVSSFLALADERGAVVRAEQSGRTAVIQKSGNKQRQHEYRSYRHYRGYDDGPAVGA